MRAMGEGNEISFSDCGSGGPHYDLMRDTEAQLAKLRP